MVAVSSFLKRRFIISSFRLNDMFPLFRRLRTRPNYKNANPHTRATRRVTRQIANLKLFDLNVIVTYCRYRRVYSIFLKLQPIFYTLDGQAPRDEFIAIASQTVFFSTVIDGDD